MTQSNGGPARTGQIITFYSYKGGTGRTMTMANIAWILASNGMRVLAVDWDLESPGLQRYFHPFLRDKQLRSSRGVIDIIRDYAAATVDPSAVSDNPRWFEEYADVLRHAVSLEWQFPKPGYLDFLPAGQQGPSYAQAVSTFDWGNFYERLHGGVFLKALARNMREHYDYVLIDSRTGFSDSAGICTVVLPDTVVDCFTMSTQSIEGAVAVAHSIQAQRGNEPIRLLPVPMRVEDGELTKLEAGRDYARQWFEPFVAGRGRDGAERYWGDVEIPYKTFYAYEEILAPFGDRPFQENSLLAAFERLAKEITNGVVTELGPMDDRERRRLLAEYERPKQAVPTDVFVSYTSIDRVWAEWIASQLNEAGLRAVIQEVEFGVGTEDVARSLGTASQALVLLSQDYVKAPKAIEFWQLVVNRDSGTGRFLVPVRLDGVRLSGPFLDRVPAVDLAGVVGEQQARDALLAELDLPTFGQSGRRMPDATRPSPRFPATPPPVWNAPQRNATFTGRAEVLESLRDRLSGNVTVVVPQALYGLGGVGKTQVALEYAYRFAAYYDIVWWIPSEQPNMVPAALAALAEKLQLPAGESMREKVEAVLDSLRQGRPSPRWLLIFDNAGNPEELRDYNISAGPGHVVITSRDQGWTQYASAVEVGVFQRHESVSFLQKRLPNLSAVDAERVAEKLGDLPLAIEQAGAWLAATGMPVAQYLDLLDTQLTRILKENPPFGYQYPAAATWRLSLDRLRERMPAAAKLLELCAFFGPEPIPMNLINSPRFVSVLLPYNSDLHELVVMGQVIREIGRYALARIDSGQDGSLQLHRLVQAVIRDTLPAAEKIENEHHVHETLAAVNPGDPDRPDNWPVYSELRPHLVPSGALDSTSPPVRKLALDMVRFLWKRSDYGGSQELAENALRRWQAMATAGGAEDTQVLMLRFHLGNSLRSQAEFDRAYEIDEDVHERLLRRVGPDHPYTLMSAASLGADLRALSNYTRARELDEETWRQAREVFGEDHTRTLMAANNLAVTLRMVGDFTGARDLDEETLAKRRALLGRDDPDTLFSANHLGRDLREVGDYRGSREILERTLADYRQVVGHNHTATLRCAKNYAVTLRKLGNIGEARDLTVDTLERLVELHGPNHPETLACASNLSADLSALGDDTAARETAEQTYEGYRQVLGENHPFTLACANNLAIFTRKLGDPNRSLHLAGDVVTRLTATLGAAHPSTLACVVTLANAHYELHEYANARRLDEENHERMRTVLGENHPDTLAAKSNLAISLRATSERVSAHAVMEDALTRAVRVLGESHPNVVAIRGNVRLDCDIDPPSP
jgi:tetratricopeptide (TPR) repeat protein